MSEGVIRASSYAVYGGLLLLILGICLIVREKKCNKEISGELLEVKCLRGAGMKSLMKEYHWIFKYVVDGREYVEASLNNFVATKKKYTTILQESDWMVGGRYSICINPKKPKRFVFRRKKKANAYVWFGIAFLVLGILGYAWVLTQSGVSEPSVSDEAVPYEEPAVPDETASYAEPVTTHDFDPETNIKESNFGISYMVPGSWTDQAVYDENGIYYTVDTAQVLLYRDEEITGDSITETEAKAFLAKTVAGDDVREVIIQSLEQTVLICDGRDVFFAEVSAYVEEDPAFLNYYIFSVDGHVLGLIYVEYASDEYDRRADVEKIFKSITIEKAMTYDEFFQLWAADSFLATMEAPGMGDPVSVDTRQGISTAMMTGVTLEDVLSYAEYTAPACGYTSNVHSAQKDEYYEYYAENDYNCFIARFYERDGRVEYTVAALG